MPPARRHGVAGVRVPRPLHRRRLRRRRVHHLPGPSLARYRAKIDRVPAGTTFQLFCTFGGSHSTQPGWSPGTRASPLACGAAPSEPSAQAPHAAASLRYLYY